MENIGEESQERKCFIITPIGDVGSDTFRKAKGVIDSVIKPVLINHGFTDIKPAYEILESGMIGNQIIDRIVNDDLVIANLTGNNPNVMYELAIRHATAKPVIHICEKGTDLPFDIKDNRTSFYRDDMLGVQELRNEFESYLSGIDYSREYKDNPIYSAIEMANVLKRISNDGRQTEAELLQKILDKVSIETWKMFEKKNTSFDDYYKNASSVKSGYFIRFETPSMEVGHDFIKALRSGMSQMGIKVRDVSNNNCYLENTGGLQEREILHELSLIGDKYGVRISINA